MFDLILKELFNLDNLSIIYSNTKSTATVWHNDEKLYTISIIDDLVKFEDNLSIHYCNTLTDVLDKIHLIYNVKISKL